MPSLFDRVNRFARSPQGKSLIQKASERFSGGSKQQGRGKGKQAGRRRGRR